MRRVIPFSGEDGYLVAKSPDLPDCVGQGKQRKRQKL